MKCDTLHTLTKHMKYYNENEYTYCFNLVVNILLHTVKKALGSDALLLAVRPIRIGSNECSYYKYEPPQR